VPAIDGSLSSDRVRDYLRVREAMVAPRDSIAIPIGEFLARVIESSERDRSPFGNLTSGFRMARQGIHVFADGVEYLTIRAETLRDVGMGEGEFAYLDALVLHSWLEWDPIRVVEEDPLSEEGDVLDGAEESLDKQRDLMIDQLRGARREIDRLESPSAAQVAFGERLDVVLEDARGSRSDFPFQGAMPEEWVAVLEPHRERIERTLPRNAAEVLLEKVEHLLDDDSGGDGFSFRVDSH